MTARRRLFAWFAVLVLGGGVGSGCTNTGSGLGFEPLADKPVVVLVYLDRDGSRNPTVFDTAFVGARVGLRLRGATDTFRVGATTTFLTNVARVLFERVPLGQYEVVIDSRSIGDSIRVQAVEDTTIRIEAADDTVGAVARLGFEEVSISQARALPLGRRVLIQGIVLSGVQSFADMTSHLADNTGFLRLTRVSLRGGLTGNAPGDTVSVLGVIGSRTGQPTLDLAVITRFASRPAPVPLPITTSVAATARNGELDAALVRVTAAIVTDTATIAPDFRVTVTDGSGALTRSLDALIPFARGQFFAGRSLNVVGVLVPSGGGDWVLKPRTTGDVGFNN